MLAHVEQGADVWVAQPGDGFRLAFEASATIRVGAEQLRRQDFDGHASVEACVAGLVDLAHSAFADDGLNLVGSQTRAGDEAHGNLRARAGSGVNTGILAPTGPAVCRNGGDVTGPVNPPRRYTAAGDADAHHHAHERRRLCYETRT